MVLFTHLIGIFFTDTASLSGLSTQINKATSVKSFHWCGVKLRRAKLPQHGGSSFGLLCGFVYTRFGVYRAAQDSIRVVFPACVRCSDDKPAAHYFSDLVILAAAPTSLPPASDPSLVHPSLVVHCIWSGLDSPFDGFFVGRGTHVLSGCVVLRVGITPAAAFKTRT